jgi:hypothetical protein
VTGMSDVPTDPAADGTTADLHTVHADASADGGPGDPPSPDASATGIADAAVAPCRDSTDCPEGDFCIGARGGGSCKSTCPAITCVTECDAGVCRQTRATATCSIGPTTTFCQAKCESNADCPLDQGCEPSSGLCFSTWCNNGGVCQAWQSCRGAMWSVFCVANTCTSDAECAGAYCVNGACQSTPGFCAPSCD